MSKEERKRKKSLLYRIYRFFIPKNFSMEMQRGRQIGAQPGQTIGNALFQLGKRTRKMIDPKHKMKVGGKSGKSGKS